MPSSAMSEELQRAPINKIDKPLKKKKKKKKGPSIILTQRTHLSRL